MSNLTIQQFCQLETLKTDLLESDYKYQEKIKDNMTVIEVTDFEGNLLKELIVVL
ncbi:MAG: hypothetical protein AAF383_25250 [Cyanobacteria bacterium P01_A01_bin.83]